MMVPPELNIYRTRKPITVINQVPAIQAFMRVRMFATILAYHGDEWSNIEMILAHYVTCLLSENGERIVSLDFGRQPSTGGVISLVV